MNTEHVWTVFRKVTNQMTCFGQYQCVYSLLSRGLNPSKTHTVPHAICPSAKLLTNARETSIKVLDQSGLDHFIRERQLQSPRHRDDVEILRSAVPVKTSVSPVSRNLPIFSGESDIRSLSLSNVAPTLRA